MLSLEGELVSLVCACMLRGDGELIGQSFGHIQPALKKLQDPELTVVEQTDLIPNFEHKAAELSNSHMTRPVVFFIYSLSK